MSTARHGERVRSMTSDCCWHMISRFKKFYMMMSVLLLVCQSTNLSVFVFVCACAAGSPGITAGASTCQGVRLCWTSGIRFLTTLTSWSHTAPHWVRHTLQHTCTHTLNTYIHMHVLTLTHM